MTDGEGYDRHIFLWRGGEGFGGGGGRGIH